MLVRQLVFIVSLVLNLVLLYSLIGGQQGIVEYNRLYDQCRKLEERIVLLDEENVALSREIRLLQTDEKYLEKVIRSRLHFIKDNEIRYIFPGEPESESSGALAHEAKN